MFLWLYLFFGTADALRVAIAGAHGGLGRELVRQSLDRGWKTFAFIRRDDPVFEPTRTGWLSEDDTYRVPMRDKKLSTHLYEDILDVSYDALAIAIGGRPFSKDTSVETVERLCTNLPKTCKKVCLVSAYGSGDSLKNADAGIRAMSDWYLKDVYKAKRSTESIVSSLDRGTLIVRPRVLSYDSIPFNPISSTRQDVAREIVEWMAR
jgi:putative NADH-flavin reductase